MTPLQMVRQFHEAFGVPAYDTPRIPDEARLRLRRELIEEEWWEIYDEIMKCNGDNGSIPAVAKELADMVVVIYGTALEFGINLDAVLEEVHRSNLSKLDDNGRPIFREDGKVLKGKNYFEPNIAAVLGMGE